MCRLADGIPANVQNLHSLDERDQKKALKLEVFIQKIYLAFFILIRHPQILNLKKEIPKLKVALKQHCHQFCDI